MTDLAIKSLSRLYLSARANGVMAIGIANCKIEISRESKSRFNIKDKKYKPKGIRVKLNTENIKAGIHFFQ